MNSKAKSFKVRAAPKKHKPSRLKDEEIKEEFEADKIESTAQIRPEFSAELQYEGYPDIGDYDNTVLRSNVDEKSVPMHENPLDPQENHR